MAERIDSRTWGRWERDEGDRIKSGQIDRVAGVTVWDREGDISSRKSGSRKGGIVVYGFQAGGDSLRCGNRISENQEIILLRVVFKLGCGNGNSHTSLAPLTNFRSPSPTSRRTKQTCRVSTSTKSLGASSPPKTTQLPSSIECASLHPTPKSQNLVSGTF
jgi:hypothetical protein